MIPGSATEAPALELVPASAVRQVDKCIGQGGFAQVYLCNVAVNNEKLRTAALKVLRPSRNGPVPKFAERLFLSEASSCMTLNHR